MSMNKVDPKNIRDIEGICTLIDVVTSDQVADFYNNYVVPNNKQKYAAVSKGGVVYGYDPLAKKHIKLGIQKGNNTSFYAINSNYIEENVTSVEEPTEDVAQSMFDWESEAKMHSQKIEELNEEITNKNIRIQELENRLNDFANTETYEPSMQECVDRLIQIGYTVALSRIQ